MVSNCFSVSIIFISTAVVCMNCMQSDEKRIQEAFNKYDKDGNGYIDKTELKVALENIESLKQIQLAAILTSADANNDGKIDFEEFKKYIVPELNKKPACNVDATFKVSTHQNTHSLLLIINLVQKYDKNGDGFLTADEICTVSCELGYQLTLKKAEAMIAAADLNADGKISLAGKNALLTWTMLYRLATLCCMHACMIANLTELL